MNDKEVPDQYGMGRDIQTSDEWDIILVLKHDSQTFLSSLRWYFNPKDTWTMDIVNIVFHRPCIIHQL